MEEKLDDKPLNELYKLQKRLLGTRQYDLLFKVVEAINKKQPMKIV